MQPQRFRHALPSALIGIVTACFWTGAAATAAAADSISINGFDAAEHAVDLRHTGESNRFYGVEITSAFAVWDLTGASTQTGPAAFAFHDPLPLLVDATRFYRIVEGDPADVFAWMERYPEVYLDGEEADALPVFRWRPFPAPGTRYRLEVHEAIPDGDGGWAALSPAAIAVGGLAAPEYALEEPASGLAAADDYVYRVIAELPRRRVVGRWVPVTGFGVALQSEGPFLPPPSSGLTDPPATEGYTPGDWAKLLRLLKEIAEKKDAVAKAIAENPFVEEAELLRQLAELLKNPAGITDVVEDILSDPDQLADPELALKALCYLNELLDFVTLYDDKLSESKKAKLKRFKEKIEELKERLEMASDRQSELPKIIEELKGLKDEFADEDGDPVGYLRDLIKEKLLEKLEKILAKKIGEKAAGAIVSIIGDLINFGDLLLQLYRLDELCEEYNRLLLEGIANDPAGATEPRRLYSGKVREDQVECTTITIAYKKLCWKPAPDGDPNEGDWEESPVPMADGSESASRPASEIQTGDVVDGRRCLEWVLEIDPTSLQCPEGAGPCIVFCEITKTCSQPRSSNTSRIFTGVIRCP